MIKDPVCGMEVEPSSAFAMRQHTGQMFYFCSQSCVEQFDADPHRHAMAFSSVTVVSNANRLRTFIPRFSASH